MSYDPDKWMISRYTVCRVGEGYSVEDKKTGERVSFHSTIIGATQARDAASKALMEANELADRLNGVEDGE